ncbi:hypothetical protein ACFQY5_04650 [Paeniroseomonas aquatica]|uniref:hypothetical protein n=1 Tax=Paeniroseomonas aquatica TaxID=373043 RepID=UPI003606D7C6
MPSPPWHRTCLRSPATTPPSTAPSRPWPGRCRCPAALSAAGIRRYGFHGLSYEYVAGRLDPALAAGRVIIAHLGNGASLCALRGGRSIATTMGFTAAEGLMMGTRCGSIDPGVLIHLMDRHGLGPRELEALIYRQSGLLGVSGLSQDMRTLRASAAPEAAEAIALFTYRILREIGSLAAALGGLDGLVFTAGIGENDAALRAAVCEGAAGSGWCPMPRATPPVAPASAPKTPPLRPGSSRPTRKG